MSLSPSNSRSGQSFNKFRIGPEQGRRGQSLIEALIAMAIGALIVGSAVGSIVLTIRINSQNRATQTANSLSQELIDGARSVADSVWPTLYGLTKGGTTNYYLVPGASGNLTIVTGKEGVLQDEIKNGLVGHWKMDEASVTSAYDSSGNVNTGTLTNSPTRTSNCKVSDCLTFNGTNSYVNAGNGSSLNVTSSFTLNVWLKTSSTAPAYVIAKRNTDLDSSIAYNLNIVATSGYAQFYVSNGTTNASVSGNTNLADNSWHHVMGVFESGSAVKVYVDGTLQSTTTTSITSVNTNTAPFTIGAKSDGSTVFNGSIDDVRIYNRALSSDEVSQVYRSRIMTRYFSVENVSRDSSSNIVTTGGTEDPSTQKITATTNWTEQGVTTNVQFVEFLTRSKDEVTKFTNWNGGSGVEGPVTEPNTGYSSQTGVDATTTPGSVQTSTQ